MNEINLTIEVKDSQPLSEQSALFQAWFSETIQSKIDFRDSCIERDQFDRPKIWSFSEYKIKVEAIYSTQDSNFTFNHFIINTL